MAAEPPPRLEPHWAVPHPLDTLEIADPQMAAAVRAALAATGIRVPVQALALLVSETIAALAMTTAFGQAVADGCLRLVGQGALEGLHLYANRLKAARREGAGLGQLLAESLPAVLLADDDDGALLDTFDRTLATLLTKGVYTLKGPLGLVSKLLEAGERAAARALLNLLDTCFAQPLTYNRSIYMTQFIPQAVGGFDRRRRAHQIDQLQRVIQADHHLAEPFVDGLTEGAGRLSAASLEDFVSRALAQRTADPDKVRRYLALASHSARTHCHALQTSVSLAGIRRHLTRYLQARLGRSVAIRNLEDLGGNGKGPNAATVLVAADGRHLYLPAECDRYEGRQQNRELFKTLVKLEAACFEYGSFDFDLQRFYRLSGRPLASEGVAVVGPLTDLERFLAGFPSPALAEALMTIFEHGRLRLLAQDRYPGLARQVDPVLSQALDEALGTHATTDPLLPLYAAVALGRSDRSLRRCAGWPLVLDPKIDLFAHTASAGGVETSALLVEKTYGGIEARLRRGGFSPEASLERLWTPFGRRLRPELIRRASAAHDRTARRLRRALARKGIRLFQSDLRKRLQRQEGSLERADLDALYRDACRELGPMAFSGDAPPDLSSVDLEALLAHHVPASPAPRAGPGEIFRYPEWDDRLGEYLANHTLVRERYLPTASQPFYRRTLAQHAGLVARVRHAFELLKPQGLRLLRPWREGDSFDYRALVNFAVEKKAGLMPSDRLYVKRIKQQRDVAVLLLVDLSRSTANRARETRHTVLQVTQTAIVLFCEALQVVGDRFAIAGFSGTGRLGVDYLSIKAFDDGVDRQTKGRIAAMTPLRATRMGAAIRHATHRLAAIPASVRLLLVLGDGFPNDTDYKGPKAIADTRRAIQEAHARQIHTKGITVNIGSDARLDELYGRAHHTVIQDVRDLPDRLFEIYGRLTRM